LGTTAALVNGYGLAVTVIREYKFGGIRDGVVTGIQIRAQAGDIAHKGSSKTPIKPLWLQPVLVNRVENLRVFGL
jgi:hypothetical protein